MKTPYAIARYWAKRAGRRDAALNFPQPNQPVSGQLGEYEHNCTSQQLDESMRLHRRLDAALEGIRIRNEDAQKHSELLTAKQKFWQGREDGQSKLPRVVHYLLLGFMVGAELVFNEIALRPLGLNPIHTAIMVLGVGITLAILSDYLGRKAKESTWRFTNLIIVALAIGVVVAISVLVAKSRTDYLASHSSLINGLAAQKPSAGIEGVGTWIMFIAMQLGLVLLGMVTSFLSHDPMGHQRSRYSRAIAKRDTAYDRFEYQQARSARKADQHFATYSGVQAAYLGENLKHRGDGVSAEALTKIVDRRPDILKQCPELPQPKGDLPPIVHRSAEVTTSENGVARKDPGKRARSTKEPT